MYWSIAGFIHAWSDKIQGLFKDSTAYFQGLFIYKILTFLCLYHYMKSTTAILTRETTPIGQYEHLPLAISYSELTQKYVALMREQLNIYF